MENLEKMKKQIEEMAMKFKALEEVGLKDWVGYEKAMNLYDSRKSEKEKASSMIEKNNNEIEEFLFEVAWKAKYPDGNPEFENEDMMYLKEELCILALKLTN